MNLNFKDMKILIDNGHGNNTLGKCSPDNRLREYAWAREIAVRLVDKLRLSDMMLSALLRKSMMSLLPNVFLEPTRYAKSTALRMYCLCLFTTTPPVMANGEQQRASVFSFPKILQTTLRNALDFSPKRQSHAT